MVNKAFKVRLYPNKSQKEIIDKTIGCSRFIYNQMLAERIEIYQKLKDNKDVLYSHKYKTEKQYKVEYPFLKEASSRALQQSRGNLDIAYKNFFKHNKSFPKFKSKHKSKLSYREPQIEAVKAIEIKENKLKFNKVSWIKFRGLSDKFKFTDKICSVTISKDKCNNYFASILVETNQTKKLRTGVGVIGIDLGLKEFVTCSDGQQFNGIKEQIKVINKKIDKQHKHFSRKKNPSNRKEKCRVKLAKLYNYKTNIQNHFFWHLSNKLCSENQAISLENLNVSGIKKNRKLSKAIHMVAWSKFIVMLKQKALEYGTDIYEVNRFFPSSKTCSCCGSIKDDLKLSDRTYECECGLKIDRDLNAAINIKKAYLKSVELADNSHGEILRPIKFNLNGNFCEVITTINQI